MSLSMAQWNHIGTIAQRPSADNFSVGYTYLASDIETGFVVELDASDSSRHWQQVFCQCWQKKTPTSSIKNTSATNQTLPPTYGSVTLAPGHSVILPNDPEWVSYTLKTNGILVSNFSIGQVFQEVSVDVDIYVDGATGNDANPGTQALPVATVRQGFRLWPTQYSRTCNLHVSGTTNESSDDLVLYPPVPVGPDAQPPCIIGNMADVGLGLLTVQSFSPNVTPSYVTGGDTVVPTTSLPLSFDLYAGQEYYCVSSAGGHMDGRVYTIMNNDTGAFYLPHSSHNFQPTPGDTFRIRSSTTTITLNAKWEIRGQELAMYGFNVSAAAGKLAPVVVCGSKVYPDSVQFNTFVEVIGGGVFAPGHTHNLCVFPGSPPKSIGTVGCFMNTHIVAFNGRIGDFRYITGDGSTAPTGLFACVLVQRNGRLYVQDGTVNLFVADLRQIFLSGASFFIVIEHWRLYGSPGDGIYADGPVYMDVEQVDISGCVGNGITLDDGAVLYGGFSGGNVAGNTNGGYGMQVSHGVKATVINTTITGQLGNVKVGSNTVDTWTNIATGQALHTTDFNASSSGVATSQGCRVGP